MGYGKFYIPTGIHHVYPSLGRRCVMAKDKRSQDKKAEEKKVEKGPEKAKKN
ncbi:MAG TPA: hypothetical protein P5131_02415 [Methanoculleus sp.]|nr:hypothetical protein [Methanoculleus sp.]HRT12002.1 hypothetical protein [Methanoculleus sp.]